MALHCCGLVCPALAGSLALCALLGTCGFCAFRARSAQNLIEFSRFSRFGLSTSGVWVNNGFIIVIPTSSLFIFKLVDSQFSLLCICRTFSVSRINLMRTRSSDKYKDEPDYIVEHLSLMSAVILHSIDSV